MSDLNSWEDDPAAQADDNLARQTQRSLNVSERQTAQSNTFRPDANSFNPGSQSFVPQNQPYTPQYGAGYDQSQYGYYNQQQAYYPQYGQGGYPQYKQGSYGGAGYGQGGYGEAYGHQYGGYNQQQQYQSQAQQQHQRQAPVIAKRPTAGAVPDAGASASSSGAGEPETKPPATSSAAPKVLKIGGDSPAPKAKVLSIGTPAPAAPAIEKKGISAGEGAGSKAAAAKAIEKTEKSSDKSTSLSGKTPSAPTSGKTSPAPADMKALARQADAVAKEQAEDVDEETLAEVYGKEHVNLIFIGHVDAGKSTLGGSILYATGMVDERTMDKYKREAKEAGRETWYLSWALDLTKEERSKGKTVEVGRGFFETDKRRYTILDAPGHKTFVPNMIGGASQADVGILVISARKGEYETGFEKGGQTREHAVLAKTQGVNKLVVVVNKMDDPTVEWSKERYDECTTKLTNFLRGTGYNPKTDLMMMPVSAQTSVGIKDRVPKKLAPWWNGPSLLEYLDGMQTLERKVKAPFMMPINGKYRDMGTMIEGKIESGVIKKGQSLIVMPNKQTADISAIYGETEDEIPLAMCGDQVRLRIRGIEEEDIFPGFVLCSSLRPVHCVQAFEAQIRILELKSILSAGFNCVLHVHSAIEEVSFAALLHKLEKGTGRKSKKPPPFAAKGQSIIARLEVTGGAGAVCVERFEDYPQLGRFTLRDQGQTIAIGKITKLITDTSAAAAAAN
ncbi:translation termination factor GTPase eRF3 [Glutinoglossum americanum]|uniref:Elongation factor 1-alpha n=1 Tax=Glutinoglossum americanum TaxID=1670608 RepID=A0A9P8I0L5_9PEZI|nr:translation termination factor GTPase eRF3 [Glutinoglossum americanum]